MGEKRRIWPMVILLFALLAFGFWWKSVVWRDCKKVGHSTLYCLGRIGE